MIQSPVLVGRDDLLALAGRRLAEAGAGSGQLLFVAGEAGIGKTRLLSSIATSAHSFTVVRAAAFPGDMESSAGLLLDLASELRSIPALAQLGGALAARVRDMPESVGDRHRRRRIFIQDVVDLIHALDSATLITFEDLHWADELSLDVLAHLAVRIRSRPILIAASYRSDEIYPATPLRTLRTRLLSQRLAEEIRLPRLNSAQIATMTSAVLGRPAPTATVQAIYSRSDGIPLHVEELLAASDESVPETLADAILARAAGLSPLTREVACAAAVIGRSFDFDLLTSVSDPPAPEVGAALRELQTAYLVLPGLDANTFDFRHALIREALYGDIDVAERRRLHERVATVAAQRGYRDAFVSAHYEMAARADEAFAHAVAAAREASAMSAHREALELYRRAARHLPSTLDAVAKAELFAALGDEAAAVDDNEAATQAYQIALTSTGDPRAAAGLVPRIVGVRHLLGDGLGTRIATLREALLSIEKVVGAQREHARLRSAMATAYMLDRRLDEAIEFGAPSLSELRALGDTEAVLNAAATHGSVLVFAGQMDAGWALLESAIVSAREAHQEAETARGYRMLGSSASVLVEYERAERWLADGIRYAEHAELWNHRHYMAAHLAHVRWATGQWDLAKDTAEQALADGRGGVTTRITAEYVLGYLALGRAEWARAKELLESAFALGEKMGELQRLSPPLWGLAESARCQGDHETAIALCDRGFGASAEVGDAAYLFPFLVTGVRAHLARADLDGASAWLDRVATVLNGRSIPGTLPAIVHAQGLIRFAHGDVATARELLTEARAQWQARQRVWEDAWARLDLAQVAAKARRRAQASRLIEELRALDIPALPLDTPPAGEPWHPLSAREFEVAQLVALGLTNRQIAERLVLAPKTISAHIEHILTKLGASRRTEIAVYIARASNGRADRPNIAAASRPRADRPERR